MEELARPTGPGTGAGGGAARSDRAGSRDAPGLGPPTPRVALVAAAVLGVGILLYLGRDALPPFVVGLLIVYLLDPPVERLSRASPGGRRIPRWLAILAVYAIAIAAVVVVLELTLQPLVRQLADFLRHLPELAASLDALLRRISDFYAGLQLPQQIRDLVDNAIADLQSGTGGLDPMAILIPVVRSAASLLTTVFAFFIVPFWAFYILKDRPGLMAAFDAALPAEWRPDIRAVLWIANTVFGRWVRGQLILGLVVGLATFIGLLVLGALIDPVFWRFSVLFAVLAGLLELLPIIGPIISAVPPLLVALTVSPAAIAATFVLYLGVQQVENTVLVPKIQGDAIELHPSVVVFALIVGGAIAGLLGAILALPVTAAGRDVFRYLFRRLGPEPRATPEVVAAAILGSSIHPEPGETREEAAEEAIEGHDRTPRPSAAATGDEAEAGRTPAGAGDRDG
jgi:predicted PurR-regulated permease PerM